MICNPRFHRRSNADCAVDSHEVVIGEILGERSEVILPLFAECVSQPGEAPHLHTHGKILPFDIGNRNLVAIGITGNGFALRTYDMGGDNAYPAQSVPPRMILLSSVHPETPDFEGQHRPFST